MTDKRTNGGFGLIEIMVAIVIAIVASLAMFESLSVSERQKRTATGAADAQGNGAIALYMMERDARMAGWGLQSSVFADCANIYTYFDGAPLDSSGGATLFASVAITDGANGGTDSLTIQYYDNPANPNYRFGVTKLVKPMPVSSTMLFLASNYACGVGDLVIVKQGANCSLVQVTHVTASGPDKDGLQYNSGQSPYNSSGGYRASNGWPNYTEGATVQCFPDLYRRTYRITNGSLELVQRDETGATETMQIAPQIVDLQAEYGIADSGSQQVNAWVPATGATWTAPTMTNVKRIKAVRIAVVARSIQYEKPDQTGACSATTAAMVANWSTWAAFNTANLGADWQCYRYKVFETVVPLRNVIWAKI